MSAWTTWGDLEVWTLEGNVLAPVAGPARLEALGAWRSTGRRPAIFVRSLVSNRSVMPDQVDWTGFPDAAKA